jgi:peptidoglycan-N-acetylglucosamine deacetylase
VSVVDPRRRRCATRTLRRLPSVANHVYLTFDDGPDPHWTPRVLAVLAQWQARASFFVIGRLAQQHRSLLRDVHAAGHAVCNHGWSHRHPWTLNRARALQEVRDGTDAIAQALGERPAWFRPPHGRLSPWLVDAAHVERQRILLWSFSAIDWGLLGTPERVAKRAGTARPGEVVLLHDGPSLQNRPASTVHALPIVLERFRRECFAPMPLPDVTLDA